MSIDVPLLPTLVGQHVYAQGTIVDPTSGGGDGAGIGLTAGLKLLIGE